MASSHVDEPLHFEGTNYDYYKKTMCLHLKATSEKKYEMLCASGIYETE
jgi:hypothetical protein